MKNDREQTTIRLPSELKEQLQKQAAEVGVSINELIIKLIRVGREHF